MSIDKDKTIGKFLKTFICGCSDTSCGARANARLALTQLIAYKETEARIDEQKHTFLCLHLGNEAQSHLEYRENGVKRGDGLSKDDRIEQLEALTKGDSNE